MGNLIMDLIDEKVQLTNVIRHLSNLERDHHRTTYEVSSKMLNDMRDKVIDKLMAAENVRDIMKPEGPVEYKPSALHLCLTSLSVTREHLIKAEDEFIAAAETQAEDYEGS